MSWERLKVVCNSKMLHKKQVKNKRNIAFGYSCFQHTIGIKIEAIIFT